MEIKPLGTLTAVLYLIDGLISHHQAIMLKERTKRRLGSFLLFFFFFSSIRRHTRLTCDWSSDVCSSDLCARCAPLARPVRQSCLSTPRTGQSRRRGRDQEACGTGRASGAHRAQARQLRDQAFGGRRSEERRVGKECRARGEREE